VRQTKNAPRKLKSIEQKKQHKKRIPEIISIRLFKENDEQVYEKSTRTGNERDFRSEKEYHHQEHQETGIHHFLHHRMLVCKTIMMKKNKKIHVHDMTFETTTQEDG
jgi:hypothetical protein